MSQIDLLIVLVIVLVLVWIFMDSDPTLMGRDIGFKEVGLLYLLLLLVQIPFWVYSNHKNKRRLKSQYEDGSIKQDYYRKLVGERFFRKHHGDQ